MEKTRRGIKKKSLSRGGEKEKRSSTIGKNEIITS